jgi:uncharacterized protein GlcG (DUF336 family)
MGNLTLDQATTIVDAALEKARKLDSRPLTVAVLDAGGHLVALKREDGSGILRADIATGKAWGALGVGESSRSLAKNMLSRQDGVAFLSSLSTMSGGKVVGAPGGVLIRDGEGEIIGAVGISGDASDVDEDCCIAGIEASGLTFDD